MTIMKQEHEKLRMAAEMILQLDKDSRSGELNTFEMYGLMLAPLAIFREIVANAPPSKEVLKDGFIQTK